MSQTLLNLSIVIEPDRQRLARFTIDAVEALGGNAFSAANAVDPLLRRLRSDGSSAGAPISVNLILDDLQLCLEWGGQRDVITILSKPPAENGVADLVKRLKHASESTDAAFLYRRHEQISADLEQAKQRARLEMTNLEASLEMKKNELQETMRLAQTDSLTGLYNRGAYDVRLQEAYLRCQHQGEPLCLMLLDLDNFKTVNDTYGHQRGDEYLKETANAIRASARVHVDHACRMGGDEFAIILFSDMTVAKRVAGKLLESMKNRVSIGIAQLRESDTIESLVARADAALYEVKRNGRGRFQADETGIKKSQSN